MREWAGYNTTTISVLRQCYIGKRNRAIQVLVRIHPSSEHHPWQYHIFEHIRPVRSCRYNLELEANTEEEEEGNIITVCWEPLVIRTPERLARHTSSLKRSTPRSSLLAPRSSLLLLLLLRLPVCYVLCTFPLLARSLARSGAIYRARKPSSLPAKLTSLFSRLTCWVSGAACLQLVRASAIWSSRTAKRLTLQTAVLLLSSTGAYMRVYLRSYQPLPANT